MEIDVTRTSKEALDRILHDRMTAEEAAAYLREKPTIVRSFSETLLSMCDDGEGGPLKAEVVRRIVDFYLALDPTLNRRSLTKKVQNWMADRNQPTDREDLHRIAFALDLGEDQLAYLLALTSGYAIQYRDGRELVLAWFLRNGRTYSEAVSFYESLPPYDPTNVLVSKEHSLLTRRVEQSSMGIYGEKELRAYYVANLTSFGDQHLRAYFYFERFLAQLIQPTPLPGENPTEAYTLEAVMRTYLALSMPSDRRRSRLSLVQKLIKQNWPNTTAIVNIRNHVIDVPRKLLLLLYVVTENLGISEADDWGEYFDDEPESLEDRVADHWVVLNAILDDCGMARLDLRNAFDWLVVYAVAVEDDEAMSERMERVISTLFDVEG